MSSIRETTVDALGLQTRVLESGAADANEAIVLLHGAPGDADAWRDLLPRLAPFARVVAFDLPGFGAAGTPAVWDYSASGYANFLAALLHRLGITRVHLVVTDLGGVGLHWAASHPDAFASAVIMDTGIPIGWRWHAVARIFRAPVVGAVAERAGRIGFGPVMRFYTRGPRPLPASELRTWRATYTRGVRRALRRYYVATPANASEHLAPVFRALDRPALVVWGRHDRFITAAQAERQRESFPSAEVHVLEESGHYVHLDDPEGVAARVVPFLEAQLAG